MNAFHFKNFSILQSQEVFRVGTDGVLLGALVSCDDAKNVLEVGTGTGLISLMLAQRNSEADILAIDINPNAIKLAKENFENSPYSDRISVREVDFKTFEREKTLDLVICNPPYFDVNISIKDRLARQQVELNFNQLIEITSKILTKDGIFSVIIPKDSEEYFVEKSLEQNLFLFNKVDIRGNSQSKIKRCILELSPIKRDLTINELILEVAPRVYSEEYIELTKDFHLFRK